jgi:hypothetical protein
MFLAIGTSRAQGADPPGSISSKACFVAQLSTLTDTDTASEKPRHTMHDTCSGTSFFFSCFHPSLPHTLTTLNPPPPPVPRSFSLNRD